MTRVFARRCGLLTAAVLLSHVQASRGLDVPIPAKVTVVKPGKIVKLVAKSATTPFVLPTPGSAEDPTSGGADLRIFDLGSAAGDVAFALDASGWSGLGNPAGAKGYKYKGKSDAATASAPCSVVLVTETLIKAVCKGAAVSLSPPFGGAEVALLGLPAGSASLRYCAELGGETKKNDDKLLKRKDAPAPASCASAPVSFLDPADVAELADDALLGRDNNTPGSATARTMLIRELTEMGAVGLDSGQVGDAAFLQPFTLGTNVLGLIEGSDLPGEYVIVGAHYDHIGTSCGGDGICNGATDNAAGVAAALAVGRAVAALPGGPHRSLVLAFWDREEDGLLGSNFYVNNALVPIAQTVAYVNFDIQGSNLLPSLRDKSFAVGGETGGAALLALVDDAVAAAGAGLDTRAVSYIFGQGRSDYLNFVGVAVPTVFFSDSTGPCYHTSGDEIGVVDFGKLEKQAAIATRLTMDLIDTPTPPVFAGPNPATASYSDAVAIGAAATAVLADLALFSPADQMTLQNVQAQIAAMVADGEANFDATDVTNLLVGSINLINLLTQSTCDGFL